MKTRKRIWALLLSAALMITLLPAMAFAEDAAAGEPIEVKWTGQPLRGVAGTNRLINLELDVSTFEVTYSDGARVFTYDEKLGDFRSPGVEDGLTVRLDDGVSFAEGKNENIDLYVSAPYVGKADTYKQLTTKVDVFCIPDTPQKVEFVPASGFTPACVIGHNYITEDVFYGEGNSFKVTYRGWDDEKQDFSEFTRSYYYAKGENYDKETVEGFFYKGRVTEMQMMVFAAKPDCYLKKGMHTIGFTYSEEIEELDKTVEVKFDARIKADKYDAYAEAPIYAYTGKVIRPKFKVYDSEDRLIPSKAYTYKMPKNKKMGWYDVKIKFKDKKKYVSSIVVSYGIGPATPALCNVCSRSKGLVVTWKKPAKASPANIDGMYIEVSTDKHFLNNYKLIKVAKKDMKSGSKTIKKLKKNRKYYVRAYAYKKIKQNGAKFPMYSANSKVLTAKTK